MSTENETIVDQDDVNLDDFADELFGQSKPAPEPASSESDESDEPEADAPNEDTQSPAEEDTLADEDSDDEAEEEVDDTPAKPKKSRLQERIDEVVGKQREAERKLEAALAELAAAKQTPEPKPVVKQVVDPNEPQPTDLNEDGSEKYPLGEYDPNFLKATIKYTLDTERAAMETKVAREVQAQRDKETQDALEASWAEKVAPAQERYPDFIEKGRNLIDTFEGIDASYGEYLTATLMNMEHGPDVLYYLANNTDVAQTIVNSGPQKATIALGRLEAQFIGDAEEKTKVRTKVSKASAPPPANKGSGVAVNEVADDGDDLDAFSNKLFRTK